MSAGVPQRRLTLPPGSTEIILARHGASADAIPGEPFPTLDGHSDPPLAPAGQRQAAALAERLAGEPLAAIVVSGLRRTLETAQPLAERTGLEPVVVPDLREVRLGDWEAGEWRIRVERRDPLALRALAEERWDVIPNAEAPQALAARVRRGFERIVADAGPDAVVAAILHGGVIGELCRQATDSRPFAFIHADNGSLTRLAVLPGGRWLLRNFNDTAHLDGGG
jgi:2,3-bisphosphoglycerate-dependent phosphoglycerate mutase